MNGSKMASDRSVVVAAAPSLLVPAHGNISSIVLFSLFDRRDAVDDRFISELQFSRARGRCA